MIYILFYICIALGSKRIRTKDPIVHTVFKKMAEIKMTNQQKRIIPLNISDIYDIDVYKISNGQQGDAVREPVLSLDNDNLEDIQIENTCMGLPKHPYLKQVAEYQLLEGNVDAYYTDMLAVRDNNFIYLVTDQLVLTQIQLKNMSDWTFETKVRNFDVKKILKINIDYSNGLFSCQENQKYCLLATTIGAYWFDKNSDFNQPYTTFIQDLSYINRKSMNDIYYNMDYFIVAAGADGVDIYQNFQNQQSDLQPQLHYLYSIDAKQMNAYSVNVISVKISSGRLSILDEINGLHIFQLFPQKPPELLMQIHIPRAFAFEQSINTYFIIAETPNNIEYMMELFVDLVKVEYYVNRVFVDDFTFNDIEIMDNYAIVIGEDVHMIIRHSIFNGFIPENKDLIRYFEQEDLLRLDPYRPIYENDSHLKQSQYFIGVSKLGLHVWKYSEYAPTLICKYNYGINQWFKIQFNSTLCPEQQVSTSFEQCTQIQDVHLIVDGPLLESDSIYVVIISVSCGLFIFLVIVIIVWKRGKSYYLKIKLLRKKAMEAKTYGQFQEVDQSNQSMAIG